MPSGTAVWTDAWAEAWIGGRRATDGQVGRAGRWVAANARWLRVVIGVLGAVVLLWGNDVGARLFWSVASGVVLLAVVQVLVGAGRSSQPPRPAVRT